MVGLQAAIHAGDSPTIRASLMGLGPPEADDIEGVYLRAAAHAALHESERSIILVEEAARRADALGIDDRLLRPRIMLILGNCHVNAIKAWLQSSPEIRKEWLIVRADAGVKNVLISISRRADCFIYQRGLFTEARVEMALRWLGPDCQRISFPYIAHSIFWPFYFFKADAPYPHEDTFVRRALSAGRRPVEIAHDYLTIDFASHINLNRHHAMEVAKMRRKDTECTIRLADWVMDNVTEKNLFYCPQHPTRAFFSHLVPQIFAEIGVPSPPSTDLERIHNHIAHDELPIHPKIGERYRLNYLTGMFRVRRQGRFEDMEFRQFIECYASGELRAKAEAA